MSIGITDGTGLEFLREGAVDGANYGTRLGSGTPGQILFTSEDLRYIPEEEESEEIDATGWVRDAPRFGVATGGTIETYLRFGMMDDPWAGSMRSEAGTSDLWKAEIAITSMTDVTYSASGGTITSSALETFVTDGIEVGAIIRVADAAPNYSIFQVTARTETVITATLLYHEDASNPLSETTDNIRSVTQLEQVVPGDTVYGYNIERAPAGLTTAEFHTFLGSVFDGWELQTEAKSRVQMRWPIQGRSESIGHSTKFAGGAAATAVNIATQPIFTLVNSSIVFTEGGTTEDQLTSLTMRYQPGLRPRDTIGAGLGPSSFGAGKHRITGTMRLYYEDEAKRYTKFYNETLTDLCLRLVDNATNPNEYIFRIPSVKLRTADRGTPRQEDDRFEEYEFSAFYDTATAGGFVLARIDG